MMKLGSDKGNGVRSFYWLIYVITICLIIFLLNWGFHTWFYAYGQESEFSLRFYGHGVDDIDRVKILLDPHVPADIGETDFTLEWWMKANQIDNQGVVLCDQNDGWISGNIIFDRDIWGPGDYGDFGISLSDGRFAFGVNYQGSGNTVCGNEVVADGDWHHVAVTRQFITGDLCIYVDGVQDTCGDGFVGANRNVSYRDGRELTMPNDPFLVIGAEKHDAGSDYPSYNGFVDEVRISNIIRYSGNYVVPAKFTPDDNTLALYHFDEGPQGACTGAILDSSGNLSGPSDGFCQYGGDAPAGPIYSDDSPFQPTTATPSSIPSTPITPQPSNTPSVTPLPSQPTVTQSPSLTQTPTHTFTPLPSPTQTSVCIIPEIINSIIPCFTATTTVNPIITNTPTLATTPTPTLCLAHCVYIPRLSIN
jgi:hypothetical protein